jgi:hypothetical protein
MAEHYREIAARLRALTYATPGIVHFATTLEAGNSSHDRIRAAARVLTDRERAQLVAFLVQLRHDQLDLADAERARVLGALVEALARKEWEDLPALGPDSDK